MMILKRKIKEYKRHSIESEIKSKQSVISNLKKDIAIVKSNKAQYQKESNYLGDINFLQKEIDKYQRSVDRLKEELKKYEIQDIRK